MKTCARNNVFEDNESELDIHLLSTIYPNTGSPISQLVVIHLRSKGWLEYGEEMSRECLSGGGMRPTSLQKKRS